MLTITSRVAFSSISALPKCITSDDLISEGYFLVFFLMSEDPAIRHHQEQG